MFKNLLTAGAICCALPLAGCNTTGTTQAAVEGILSNPANITPAQIEAALATVDPSLAAKVDKIYGQVSTYAKLACGIEPTVATVASIVAAFYGASAVVAPATQVAAAFCTPFTSSTTKLSAARLRPGAVVSRPVVVNGIVIKAEGTVVAPVR